MPTPKREAGRLPVPVPSERAAAADRPYLGRNNGCHPGVPHPKPPELAPETGITAQAAQGRPHLLADWDWLLWENQTR